MVSGDTREAPEGLREVSGCISGFQKCFKKVLGIFSGVQGGHKGFRGFSWVFQEI